MLSPATMPALLTSQACDVVAPASGGSSTAVSVPFHTHPRWDIVPPQPVNPHNQPWSFTDIVAMVSSPGGTTIAGIHALEQGGLRAAFMDAIVEETERSRELGSYRTT